MYELFILKSGHVILTLRQMHGKHDDRQNENVHTWESGDLVKNTYFGDTSGL